jgi:hypothetical protein
MLKVDNIVGERPVCGRQVSVEVFGNSAEPTGRDNVAGKGLADT